MQNQNSPGLEATERLFLSAREQGELIHRRLLSPRELLEDHLTRIAALDPFYGAYADVYAGEARAAADLAAAQAAEGRFLSPLHGVPVAVKDIIDIAGRVTTAGSKSREKVIAVTSAPVIERLAAAGMLVLGKTKTVEFAYGSWGTNAQMGVPRNPWARETHHVPGGSSSGSAVAVAAGLAATALGTDTGGSVRIPASMCGLVGLKPTRGLVPTRGVVPLSRTLDSVGPLTRTVEDAALMLSILAHCDGAVPDPAAILAAIDVPLACPRLAIPAATQLGELTPEVAEGFAEALEIFRSLGATLAQVHLPQSYFSCVEAVTTIISAEGYAEHGDWIEAQSAIDPHVRQRISLGKSISAATYLRVLRDREVVQGDLRTALTDYAALLTPTTIMPSVALSAVSESIAPLNRMTRQANYFGLCALALPTTLSAAGLPLSLQITGKPHDEIGILRLGLAFQRRGSWKLLNPGDPAPSL
jgi:aspartyl-tRNA(Asn)/glutamyl-tRNA(Gln) amidotransferase subunit A